MSDTISSSELLLRLEKLPRASLALLPTPIQPLQRFGASIAGQELWMKRDDLSGLEGGGNKTRKLEYIVGDALEKGADMLVTVGAIQSNHTRQTAAAAAKAGLKCALLHCAWTKNASPNYRHVGNILISHIMDADLYVDETERTIEDQGPLNALVTKLRAEGHKPYLIPGGASEHSLGCMGYVNCAAELVEQMQERGFKFDYLVHCTGSSSTQAGLLAGFAALGVETKVIGIADDDEIEIKKVRVQHLANDTLGALGLNMRLNSDAVEIVSASTGSYGIVDPETIESIQLLARTEGLIADPVYEGRAIRGFQNLAAEGRFDAGSKILLMHLGGSPALHAYAEQFGAIELEPFPK